jgi:phage terminase large subunit
MAKVQQIQFNPDLFNNIFWHLDDAFDDPEIRFIWAYGGSSASKTYSVVQRVIIGMMKAKDDNSLILRKVGSDIKDSIFQDFKNILAGWELSHLFTIQQNLILCNATGSYARFRGLDDAEKVKGITGFRRVIMEEVSQFDEADFKQIRKRLRGRTGQQIIGLFNPITEDHWIKTNVFDKEDLAEEPDVDIAGKWTNERGNMVILKTNYLDNKYIVGPHFIDHHAIADFEKDKIDDFNYYNVYGLGNWGKLRTGGEFWKDFNPNRDVQSRQWNEDQPIHMGWDQNVNPYLPCSIWQIEVEKDGNTQHKNIWQIDEIVLSDPLNRVRHVCAEFRKRYPPDRVEGLFIYGDRTAIKEDTTKEKGENFFTEIMTLLKDYNPRMRMQPVNPSVVTSGGFVNECYAGRQPITIRIDPKCKRSIFDYTYALEDSDGTLKKTKKTNKVTGVQYEEFGHLSDIKRYVLTVSCADEYEKYKRGGKATRISMAAGRRNRY